MPANAPRSKRTDAALRDAKAKAEAALAAVPYEVARPRTHWDFLLQEMGWMAADFAGERLWKIAAASKLAAAACHAAETHAARPAASVQAAAEDKGGQGRGRRGGGAVAAGVTGASYPCLRVRARRERARCGHARWLCCLTSPCACLSGFWTKAKSQGASASASAPPGGQPDSRSLESWAAQRAGHGDGAGGSKPGGRAKGGAPDGAPEERLATPPQEEPRLCYVDLAGVDGVARLSGTLLVDWAAAQEEAAWAAWEESCRDWEEGERQRARSAAEAARARRREEQNNLTVRKQHEAVAALKSAEQAVQALENSGGALPMHAGDWDAGRRRKQKRGLDDVDAGPGDAYAKRMRAQDAGLGAYAMGGGAYPHMMDAQGGAGGGAQPKRRKGDGGGEDGEGAGAQRNRNKKARQTAGQAAAAVPQPLPWSDAEMKLLVAAVREFGRPRPNWALVSDVLGQGSLLRGVFRRPDACRSQWEAVAPTVQAQEAQAAAAAAASAAAAAAAAQPSAGDAMQTEPAGGGHPPAEEGREDEDARLQRRRTLLSYLPVEAELLRLHLQRLVLVGQKYKTHRDGGDTGGDAAKRAPQVHASWGVALAEAQTQVPPDLLVTSSQQQPRAQAQAQAPPAVKTAAVEAAAAGVQGGRAEPQPDVEMPDAAAPSKSAGEAPKAEEPAAPAPAVAAKAGGDAPAPRSRARSSRR